MSNRSDSAAEDRHGEGLGSPGMGPTQGLVLRVIQGERPDVGGRPYGNRRGIGAEERGRAEYRGSRDGGDHLAAAVREGPLDLGGAVDQEGEVVVGLVLLQQDGSRRGASSTRTSRIARLLSGSTSPSQGAAMNRLVRLRDRSSDSLAGRRGRRPGIKDEERDASHSRTYCSHCVGSGNRMLVLREGIVFAAPKRNTPDSVGRCGPTCRSLETTCDGSRGTGIPDPRDRLPSGGRRRHAARFESRGS